MSNYYKVFRKYHKWFGVVLAFFFILFALSGIVLNHRGTFSGIDITRTSLPSEYRYFNWNNASVRGATQIANDSLLLYGNIGVWLTNKNFTQFVDFNQGFPKGIDKRKIADIKVTCTGEMFAATLFGLYRYNNTDWEKVELPHKEERMVALEVRGDSLLAMSRSNLLLAMGKNGYKEFSVIPLKAPDGVEKRVGLFTTIWFIHSGKIWGTSGKLIVDLGGLAMIILSMTGLFYFFAPSVIIRIKSRVQLRSRIKRVNRWSYKWHLDVGIVAALLLLIVTTTGIFLRPPLLIPIASKTVKPIKGSLLDDENFWSDNLRDIVYDTKRQYFVMATSEGIYALSPDLVEPPLKFAFQPPVSVMGINVLFEEEGNYVVGSFSGLFKWNPFTHYLSDYLTGESVKPHSTLRSPFSARPIAGGANLYGNHIFFDYNTGAFSPTEEIILPPMPNEIITKSGMSLWNLALEVHTWRIINFLISDFYILVVPIAGILGVVIIITGSLMWLIRYRRRKKKKEE